MCVCECAVAVSHTNLLFPVGIRSLQHGVTLEVAMSVCLREQPLRYGDLEETIISFN